MVRGKRAASMASAMALVLGVAACGGSDDDGGEGGGDRQPIKIMATGPVEAPGFELPSIEVGAKVAVDQINDAGGIDGRPLELVVCNDKNDPNEAMGCARRAASEDVAALVGGYSAFEPQVVPLVERSGVPWIGPTAIQNVTSDSYYLIGGEGSTQSLGLGHYFVEEGCRKIVVIAENIAASKAAAQLFRSGVSAAGGEDAEPVYGASNAADWGPVVAAALGKGADCLAFLGSVPNTPKVVAAVAQSGKDVKFATAQALLPTQAVEALGKTADGVVMTSGYLPFTSDAPAIERLTRDARKIDPDVPLDAQLESAYAAVKVFEEAAKGLSDVNAKTIKAALDEMKGFDTGVGPVVDFTVTNPANSFRRATNTKLFILEAKGGDVVLADTEPLDTAPVFEALAERGE